MGHVQGRAVPHVPRSDLRAQCRASRAQDRAGDGRPAVLRSPALGSCRYDAQQLRGGREEPEVVPLGVLISASPVTSSGARKPLSTAGTGVKWPCPSPLSHKPLSASARGVFGSASYRLPATIRSRLPSPSTSPTAIPLIGEICARLGSDDRVNVPSPVFCK